MSAETWGIVLRDRASGAEQRIACEVSSIGDGAWRANPKGMISSSEANSAGGAVKALALFIERADPTLAFVRIETPAEYAAHMKRVCLSLAIDEANDLRAEVTRLADIIGAIGRNVGAESCDRDVILSAIRERGEDAFRRGAEAMREAATDACVSQADEMASDNGALGCDFCAEAIRALPLPVEATPQPAQSHEAPATSDAPLTVADAAARARSAAAQRVAIEDAPYVEDWSAAVAHGLYDLRVALEFCVPKAARRLLLDAAGIDASRIVEDAGHDWWHEAINEAVKMQRVPALVAAARKAYPRGLV